MHDRARARLLSLLAVGPALLVLPLATAAAQTGDVLSGTASLNDSQMPAGVELSVTNVETDEECGRITVGEAGSYAVPLGEACGVGDEVRISVVATGSNADDTIKIEKGLQEIDIRFEVSDEERQAILAAVADETAGPEPGEAVTAALTQETASVFDEVKSTLIVLLAVATILLGGVGTAHLLVTRRHYAYLEEQLDAIKGFSEKQMAAAADLLQDDVGDRRRGVFRWLIEGLVLTFVVLALIVLGSAGKVTQEGLVSVLAAIVGYAAGRASSS